MLTQNCKTSGNRSRSEKRAAMSSGTQERWEAFCQKRAEETFEPVYDRVKGLVYTICHAILNNREDALDAFQSAFCRLIAGVRSGELSGSDSIERVARRLAALEAHNLRRRRARRSKREVAVEKPFDTPDAGLPADKAAADQQLGEQVKTLVLTLPEKLRTPIVLCYFHGMTQEEAAETLGLTRSAIAARIVKGRRKLEPMMRRAGLGESLAGLSAVAAGSALLQPPTTLGAAALYTKAIASAAAGSVGSATLAKTTIGAIAMKTKVIAVSACVVLAVAGIVAVSTMDKDTETVIEPGTAESQAVSEPSDEEVTVSAKVDIKTPEAKEASSVIAPAALTPLAPAAPTPQDESEEEQDPGFQNLPLKIVWEATGKGVPGAMAACSLRREELPDMKDARITDEQGRVDLNVSTNWANTLVRIQHPDAATVERFVTLPCDVPEVIGLRGGTTVFGTVYIEGQGFPAAGAEVFAMRPKKKWLVAEKTMSGSNGEFEISGLSGDRDPFALVARKGNLRSYFSRDDAKLIEVTTAGRNGPHDLVLRAGEESRTLRGFVRDELTGAPIGGAGVSAHPDFAYQATTGAAGEYEIKGLPVDPMTVEASAEGYMNTSLSIQMAQASEARLDFALGPAAVLDILALDESLQPIGNGQVYSTMFYGGGKSNVAMGGSRLRGETDSTGRARLTDVNWTNPSPFCVAKDGYGRSEDQKPEFTQQSQHAELTFVLKSKDVQAGAFAGTVTNLSGSPLKGVDVRWAFSATNMEYSKSRARTGPNGGYRLDIEDVSKGRTLIAHGEGLAPLEKKSAKPGPVDSPTIVDFQMEPGQWLSGTVVDPEDNPISGAKLSIYFPREDMESDEEGRFRFESLPNKEIMVFVSADGYRTSMAEGRMRKFHVDQDVRIVLEPKTLGEGVIRGRVLAKETGEPVESFWIQRGSANRMMGQEGTKEAYSSPDGRFEIRGLDLPSGKRGVQFTVEAPGFASKSLGGVQPKPENEAEEIVVELERLGELRGIVVDSRRRPIEGAHVTYRREAPEDFNWATTDQSPHRWTDENGAFSFAEQRRSGAFAVRASGFARTVLHLENCEKDEEGSLVIALQPGATVRAQPSFGVGNVTMSWPSISRKTPSEQWFEEGRSQPGGEAVWEDLDQGGYVIHASFGGGGALYEQLGLRFDLGQGEQKSLMLGANMGFCSLSGQVVQEDGLPLKRGSIALRPEFEWNYTLVKVRLDGEGRYRAEGLAPGTYKVDLYRGDRGGYRMEEGGVIDVAGETAKDFVFKKTTSPPTRR